MLLTLWVVFTISFPLMRMVQGDPFVAEKVMSPEVKQAKRERYGYNLPLTQQYFHRLKMMIFHADLGESPKLYVPVSQLIVEGFPVSASLGVLALSFAIVLGIGAGIVSAVDRYSVWDVLAMSAATLGIAVPNFVLASVAILLFVFYVPIFPAGGWGSVRQLVLPAICLGAPFAAYIARLTRTGMLEVLNQDYIRTAHAKGLSQAHVVLRHALRGALLPVVSYLGPAIAGVLTGSLVLEKIFFIPGMGSHFIEAATQRDYEVALAMVLVYTFLLFAANTLVDLAYVILDPRVKLQ